MPANVLAKFGPILFAVMFLAIKDNEEDDKHDKKYDKDDKTDDKYDKCWSTPAGIDEEATSGVASSLAEPSPLPDMAHSNAELFLLKQDKRTVKSVLLRHWHLNVHVSLKDAQGFTVLGPTSKKGKTTCMYMAWTATRGMHFSTPPSQPRQGVATYSLLCRSNPSGRRQHLP